MIRRVAETDVPAVVELVYDLARYERLEHECGLTEQQLTDALFCESPKVFGHVAEVDGAIGGFSLWFLNFSTWRGVHGIYLEDLYVRPEHRGLGLGKQLLQALAQECVERGYARLEWSVLDWNEPSINFYKAAGAIPMDEWTVFRLTDDALRSFAG
ncbi:GNAT family N-acetyltransferase [Saccharopolyspora taberi]|uniref:GNAT family N-acetyltransferase n=1 Tax=Saccharopolyspora taberi TaxID=60895 RepID=A0ABN3VF52_9PSEU